MDFIFLETAIDFIYREKIGYKEETMTRQIPNLTRGSSIINPMKKAVPWFSTSRILFFFLSK